MEFLHVPQIIKRLSQSPVRTESAFGDRTKTISECVGVSADGRTWRYFRSEERNADGVLCMVISYGFNELPPGTTL